MDASQASSLLPLASYGLFPATLREPLGASVTLWEATAPVKLPAWPCLPPRLGDGHETQNHTRVVFHRCLPHPREGEFSGSHLSYARTASCPDHAVVKLPGLFFSCRGKPVSSPALQFRRALCRDSAQVVTPFVRVGTYPTRNFATLGPFYLRPPFTGASVRSLHHALSPSGTQQ